MFVRYDWGTPMYDQSIFLRDLVLRKPLKLKFSASELIKEINYIHIGYVDVCYDMICCLILKKINVSMLQLKKMAVNPIFQKKGYGSMLIREAENIGKQEGYKKIMLHAREEAIGFYSKLNYKIIGNKFIEIGIPHFKMEKSL